MAVFIKPPIPSALGKVTAKEAAQNALLPDEIDAITDIAAMGLDARDAYKAYQSSKLPLGKPTGFFPFRTAGLLLADLLNPTEANEGADKPISSYDWSADQEDYIKTGRMPDPTVWEMMVTDRIERAKPREKLSQSLIGLLSDRYRLDPDKEA